MHSSDRQDADTLWAITAYFNPAGYKRRLRNYHAFRERCRVPLVTVELSFDGAFQLRPTDADSMIQLHGGDIMWQKERLLNIALRQVPHNCDKIAWVDCDVILDDGWPERACRALDEFALVHLFRERYDLPPDADLDTLPNWEAEPTAFSSIYKMKSGQAAPDELSRTGVVSALRSTVGLAWAGRREVLARHGFYDACVIGGGDRAMVCAGLGRFDDGTHASRMNPRRAQHYLEWAHPFFEAVRGRIGYIPGRIFHLWHGDLADRQYGERFAGLADFDPVADIALGDAGAWRWSSNKPELHAFVTRYFDARKEDGPVAW